MAFTCTIIVPGAGALKPLTLNWLAPQGTMIAKGDALFTLRDDTHHHVFHSNMSCHLAKFLVAEGSRVQPEEAIVVAWAEGEDYSLWSDLRL
jgi:hypothetical protein